MWLRWLAGPRAKILVRERVLYVFPYLGLLVSVDTQLFSSLMFCDVLFN